MGQPEEVEKRLIGELVTACLVLDREHRGRMVHHVEEPPLQLPGLALRARRLGLVRQPDDDAARLAGVIRIRRDL
jgi:hypothetical protein